MTKKGILMVALYLGLVLGISGLLVLAIGQSYPVFDDSLPSKWQIHTLRLTVEPQGQYALQVPLAFTVQKGQATLMGYSMTDRSVGSATNLEEGKTFGSTIPNFYTLTNRQSQPLEVILVQVTPPLAVSQSQPAYFYNADLNRDIRLILINTKYLLELPRLDDLKQMSL